MKKYIIMNSDFKNTIIDAFVVIALLTLAIWNIFGLLTPNLVNKNLLLFVDCPYIILYCYYTINIKKQERRKDQKMKTVQEQIYQLTDEEVYNLLNDEGKEKLKRYEGYK